MKVGDRVTMMPRISLLCAWYDLWVGAYWDARARKLYVLPFPCIGFVLAFGGER